jgi:endo-1,4-beta-xylanase
MRVTRMAAVGAVAAAVLLTFQLPGTSAGATHSDPNSAQNIDQPLRALTVRHDLRVGTAVNMDAMAADPVYNARVGTEFNTVTPENVMKWGEVEKVQGAPDYSQGDALVAFARAHGQKVRAHTLVWHNQLPTWLTDGVTAGTITDAQLRTILRNHIFSEAGHFRGKIWQWDVFNEVLDNNGVPNDFWTQHLGTGIIADAFRWAHAADPHALLFYNDFNIEFNGAKHDGAVALIKSLVQQHVPIDGVGIQGHLGIQFGLPDVPGLSTNVHHFSDLNLAVAFTELDVRMVLPNDNIKAQAQAQGYNVYFQVCLLNPRCLSVTVWGFTDKYSWIPGVFTGQGAANLLDENFNAKPAYQAVRTVLAMSTGTHHRF